MLSLAAVLFLSFQPSCLVVSSPSVVPRAYAIKESHNVPLGWKDVGRAPSEHMVSLQIGLAQHRFGELRERLLDISDPGHPSYGQHLNVSQIHELIRPSTRSLTLVEDWLGDAAVQRYSLNYSPAKDWIKIKLPIHHVETLLNTTYSVYEHDSGARLIRTPTWSLPIHLHRCIDTVQPTNSFLRLKPWRSTLMPLAQFDGLINVNSAFRTNRPLSANNITVANACGAYAVLPNCLRTLYGTLDYKLHAPGKVSIGVTNFLGETSNRNDTRLFLEKTRPEAVDAASDFKATTIKAEYAGPLRNLKPTLGQEGNLDAQTALGIAYPMPLTTYDTAGQPPFQSDQATLTNTNEPYADFLDYILNEADIPNVISSSYGDDEQTVPKSYATRVCNSFAQLGARGVSVIVSSGDFGVGPNDGCLSNDGKNTTKFVPSFPASCPFVTTIGGTKNFSPEEAAYNPRSGYASGGGFSNYFGRPKYQDRAGVVGQYIGSLNGSFDGLYNKIGRFDIKAYPDISAQSQRFLIAWKGAPALVDGTSAATPTVAAIIALVNDALVADKKPVLGFLNPWLYATGYKAFTDITSGSARGCGTNGFPAGPGWDPVTGFGTPYFPNVKRQALAANDENAVYER